MPEALAPGWAAAGEPRLVSVALCTYNGGRYIDEQIASVLAQRDVNLEVVVCDDGSTDDTCARVQAWAERDARLRLRRNARRLGFSANFAQAMVHCRGEFIAPCDQDDRWHADKLALLLGHIGEASLCYCDSALVDEQGRPLGQRLSDRTGMYSGRGVLPLCFWNSVSGHAMLFRRALLDKAWPFPADGFHDWWLAAAAASQDGVRYLAQPLVDYRQHERSQTDVAQRRAGARDSWRIYERRARWLHALARLPGADQAYCRRLGELWSARARQWFCPALCRHLADRSDELMRLNRRERFARFALKQFFGQRWRRRS